MGIGAALFGSSALGAAASGLTSILSFSQQKKLQENQAKINYQYAEKSARNSPSWNRAGLESAGYNPMLAVQNATSGANSSWTSGGQASTSDFVGGIESGVNNVMSYINAKNQTAQTESQVQTNEATAENQRAEAANKRAENPFIPKREAANLGKIGAETSKIDAETDHYRAMIDNMKQRLELERELGFMGLDVQREGNRIGAYNATTSRKSYDLQREMFEGSQDKFMSDWAKKHPNLYGAYRHLDNTAALAGRVFGAASQFNNHETIEKVNFDRNGAYKGHSRMSKHKSRKRR